MSFASMNLYAVREPFDDADERDGRRFATQAAVVLANASAYWDAVELAEGLRTAMKTRSVIDMAKGKLMAFGGASEEEAFALLVSASQRENVKLAEIARRIVESSWQPQA